MSSIAPRALFLGLRTGGHWPRFLTLRMHTRANPHIRPLYRWVDGDPHTAPARWPSFLPAAVTRRASAVRDAAPFAMLPRPDVIWTSAVEVLFPYLWAQTGPLRRPLVLELDATLAQVEPWSPLYFGRPTRKGARGAFARLRERAAWQSVTLFTPMSHWAAESLRRQGVPPERIEVLFPGVDLEQWRPRPELRRPPDGRLRLLFVGGDFIRKGGDLLLEVVRTRFPDQCIVDIVTRADVPASAPVRVHRAEPHSPLLRELYARADIFVLPTRADCSSISAIEAMASGLPVILGDVGGSRDIVGHGESGWLITPDARALAHALEDALAHRDALPAMGRRARAAAEQRFDGRRNHERLVELLVDQVERHASTAGRRVVHSARRAARPSGASLHPWHPSGR